MVGEEFDDAHDTVPDLPRLTYTAVLSREAEDELCSVPPCLTKVTLYDLLYHGRKVDDSPIREVRESLGIEDEPAPEGGEWRVLRVGTCEVEYRPLTDSDKELLDKRDQDRDAALLVIRIYRLQ